MHPPSVKESAAALGRKAVPIGSPLTFADYVEARPNRSSHFLISLTGNYITLHCIIPALLLFPDFLVIFTSSISLS